MLSLLTMSTYCYDFGYLLMPKKSLLGIHSDVVLLLVFLSSPLPHMKQSFFCLAFWAAACSLYAQTVPTPPQTDHIIQDNNSNGKADPGDKIRYQVTIQNTGTGNATGVKLQANPDSRTTLDGASFRTSPVAVSDGPYACTGNVGISVPAASGVKANDFDDNLASATLSVVTAPTNGAVTLNNDGSFTYTPNAGYTGSDQFTYEITDATAVAGHTPASADIRATVSITVSDLIWFIDNASAAATSDGRRNSPFKTLADFNTGSTAAASVVYIEHTGTNYTGGIVLANNERLFGEGHTGGANLSNVLPFTLAANSVALPAINGSRPVITNAGGDGVTLADGNTLRGFDVGACSDFGIENTGTASVGDLIISEVSINNTSGGGLDASNGSGFGMNVVLSSLSSSGGTNGFNLVNCGGSFSVNAGTISNPSGTGAVVSGGSVVVSCLAAITDNSGLAVDIDNHDSGNVTFSGNITSTASGIRVQNCGGGTKTFSGRSKSLNTGTSTAVTLSSNTGATINFTNGGLDIDCTTATGFNATGGGTVTVQGTGNSITSTTGTALNVNATTIGASGLTFQSISHNGGTNGIVLNTTGSSGGLTVTGTGSANSGGTIQNTTGDGISLQSTSATSLSWMNVTGCDGSGIYCDELTGFSFSNCSITQNGDDAGGGVEAGIRFHDIYGTCSMTNTTVAESIADNVRHTPSTGTLTNLTITGCTFGPKLFATGGNGYAFVSNGTAAATITVSNSTFTGNFASGFLTTVGGTSLTASFSNCTFTGNNIGVDFGNGPNSDVTFSVNGCTFLNHAGSAMNIVSDANSTNAASYHCTINNNTIGNGTPNSGSVNSYGIAADFRGDVMARLSITNNTIQNTDIEGIFVQGRLDNDADAEVGNLSLTLRDNTVFTPDDNSAFPFLSVYGIRVESRNTYVLCLDIASNTSASVGAAERFRVRQRDTSTFNLERFVGDGTNVATVAAFIVAQNDAGSTASATVATTYTGVADGACPNP
jgi:hypothetical protein